MFFKDRKIDFSKIKFADGVTWGDEPFLVLYGEPGSGKTWRLLSYLNQWEGWEFVSMVELFTEIRGFKHADTVQEIFNMIYKAPRMILDDVGFEPEQKFVLFGTEYIPKEEIKNMIALREFYGLKTGIATNWSPDMIRDEVHGYGERIYSRLVGAGKFYCFEGDRRDGKKARVFLDPVGKCKVKSKVSLYPEKMIQAKPLTGEEKKKSDSELVKAVRKMPGELQSRFNEMIVKWKLAQK